MAKSRKRSAAAKKGWRTRCSKAKFVDLPACKKYRPKKKEVAIVVTPKAETYLPSKPIQKRIISSGLPKISSIKVGGTVGAIGWVAALGFAAAFLWTRRAQAKAPPFPTVKEPEPIVVAPLTIEDEEIVKKGIPEEGLPKDPSTGGPIGYRRATTKEASNPEVLVFANQSLKEPMGKMVFKTIDGKNYAAVLEKHYHEPGGPLKPWGEHKGVSMFVEN